MLNWAITFLLLGFVSIFFTMIGTAGEFTSLFARGAAVSLFVASTATFAMHLFIRHRHPGSG